jgi:DNA (cytosine-5)-methyltransferase 1
MRVPVLSFFTGGGFLDIGFELAGFDIAWTNELNPMFAAMYAHGMTSWRKSTGIGTIPAAISNSRSVTELTAALVLREAFGRRRPRHFGAIGGPPCSDFSAGGRNSGAEGTHGHLTRTFIEITCALKADWFLMENVPGLYRTWKHRAFLDEIIERAEKRGYVVDLALLNALEFGVPQDRERLFVVGIRRRLAAMCLGRPVRAGERGWYMWPQNPKYRDARNLPWPTIAVGGKVHRPSGIPLELTVYPLLTGRPGPESLPNGMEFFRPYSHKFSERAEGDCSSKSFKRLHRYRYSPTAWYGNNEVHLHPWRLRRLSVREALRIQSVPDEYVLPPNSALSVKFKLICNGVPCRMAQQIAESLRLFLAAATKTSAQYQRGRYG